MGLPRDADRPNTAVAAVLLLLLLLLVLLASTGSPGEASAKSRRCNDPTFASGELVVKGVSCRRAARVIRRALDRPGCTPTAEQKRLHRGCYASTRVGRWRCKGLFPGEGFDLRCRSGARRIHGGAGG